jgi:hypothetical protein
MARFDGASAGTGNTRTSTGAGWEGRVILLSATANEEGVSASGARKGRGTGVGPRAGGLHVIGALGFAGAAPAQPREANDSTGGSLAGLADTRAVGRAGIEVSTAEACTEGRCANSSNAFTYRVAKWVAAPANLAARAAVPRIGRGVSASAASARRAAARSAGASATVGSPAALARLESGSGPIAALRPLSAVCASAGLSHSGHASTARPAARGGSSGACCAGGTTRSRASGRSSRWRRVASATASCAPAAAAGVGSLAVASTSHEAQGECEPKRKPVSSLHWEILEGAAFHESTCSATGTDAGSHAMEMTR